MRPAPPDHPADGRHRGQSGLGRGGLPQGEFEVAWSASRRGRRAVPSARSIPSRWPRAWPVLASIRQAADDHAGALEAMAEAEAGRAGPGRDRPARSRPGAAGAASAGPGRHRGRRRLDGAARSSRQTTAPLVREPEHLVCVRVLLARASPDRRVSSTSSGPPGRRPAADGRRRAAGHRTPGPWRPTRGRPARSPPWPGRSASPTPRYVRLFAEWRPMRTLAGRQVAAQRTRPTAAGRIPLAYLGQVLLGGLPQPAQQHQHAVAVADRASWKSCVLAAAGQAKPATDESDTVARGPSGAVRSLSSTGFSGATNALTPAAMPIPLRVSLRARWASAPPRGLDHQAHLSAMTVAARAPTVAT